MVSTCIIKRDNKKKVVSVSTRSGDRSMLFDKIASIPLMENRERATTVFKTVFSNKFLKAFGDWRKRVPINKQAYNKVKSNIDLIPEAYRERVLDKASKMSNPVLVSKSDAPYEIRESGFGFYSQDLGDNIMLVDAMVPSSISVPEGPGIDAGQYLQDAISSDFTPVSMVRDKGVNYMVIKDGLKIFSPEELPEADSNPVGVTYQTGEPRLFFMNDRSQLFEDYGEALRSGGNDIRIGFLSGTVQESTVDGVADITYKAGKYVLNNPKSFIPVMTASASTSLSTKGGIINYLIKKGLLSGSKIFDPETRSYYLTGEGHTGQIRLFNSALSYTELRNHFGSDVSMNDQGMITINSLDNSKVTMRLATGGTERVSKEQIKSDLKSGRYNELDAKYDHFDALVVSFILEDNDLYADTKAKIVSDYSQEERNQRNSIVEILKTLGVSVVGMTDYIEKYQTKYGHEPSAKALADIANNVIAVGEDATLSDLVEETAHFLVEAYRDQNAVESVLQDVEGTEEWNQYAGQYYNTYGKVYEGSELDNAVRREILGKILAREMQTGTAQAPVEPTSFLGRVRQLLSGIVNWLKSALSTQRQDLNNVIKNIRDLAITDIDKGFDTSLLKDNDFTLYSLSSMNKNKFLESKIRALRKTLRDLRQISSDRAVTTSMTLAQLKTIEDKINKVETEIDKNEMAAAMNSMISTAEAQVRYLSNVVNTILHGDTKDGKLHFNTNDRKNVDIINNQVLPIMNDLRGYIRNRSTEFDEREKQDYTNRINTVIADINGIQSDIKSVQDLDESTLLDKLMNELHVPADKVKRVKEFFDKVQHDVSWISRWFGILEHSSSPFNNALGAMIAKDNYNAMVNAQPAISDFLAYAKKHGFNKSEFEKLLQKVDGKTSNYLRSALDMAKYDRNKKLAQMRAFATAMNIEISEEEINDVVDNNRNYVFKREVVDKDGNTVTENAKFKPSSDRVNTDIFTIEQEKIYTEQMEKWDAENSELEFSESYATRMESIYKKAEEELGHPVSQTTKEYLNALSRQKRILRQPFIDSNGNFDEVAYYKSSNYEEEGLLRKQRKEAASEYIYVGTRRVEKTGDQLKMAKEIQAINEVWRKESNNVTNVVSESFLQKLRTIQNESGGEAALKTLMLGGHLSFNDRFWNDVESEQSARTESNNKASYLKMAHDIISSATSDRDATDVDSIVKDIEKNKAIIKEIIGNNRDVADIGEINEATFTSSERDAFRAASEAIEADYAILIDYAKMVGLEDIDKYLTKSSKAENEVNQSYLNALADSKEVEWKFVQRHTTAKKAKRIQALRDKLFKAADNRYLFTVSETNYLSEKLGISKELDGRDFRNAVNTKMASLFLNNTRESGIEEANAIVNEFARSQVFSYYKRMAPTGYAAMISKIGRGEIDVAQMVKDVQNGTSTQDYGMNISYLSFDPARAWVAESEAENSGRNPDYVKDHGYGHRMPKKSLYRDESYFNDFGIKYDADGNEVATKNVEQWNMIQKLKEIKRQSLSLYKEQSPNLYAIPQISKQDIERVEGLGINFKNTVRNFVSDLCLDRVDDSLYGKTRQGEVYDPEDRLRSIPKYYIYELENQDDVSHDFGYSYSMLMMQSSLYNEKQKSIELAQGLEQMLLNKQFEGGKKAEATQAYQMFRDFFNDHYYGIRMNTKKLTVNIGGYTVDLTRIMMAVERFMSVMNLALSPFVAATGALTGHINLIMESAVGQYISKDSLKYASAEFSRLAPSCIAETGDIDRKSKLYVIGERMGIFNIRNRMYGAGYNRVARTLMRSPMYAFMEILNYPLDPQVMIATMDNVRYYKGRFYTFQDFKMEKERNKEQSTIKREWNALKDHTLWSMVDVVDGKVVVKPRSGVTVEEVETQMAITRNQVRSLSQICNGSLNEENRTAASRNWIARFMTAHRGWLVLAAQRLWKRRGFNFQTMQEEEGLSITLKNMIAKTFSLASESGMKNIIDAWNENKDNMNEVEKTNIKRLSVYAGTFLIMQAVSMLLAGWRDDDENEESWLTQFGSYVGFRTINEIASQMPFIMELNVVDIINDPFVMGRKLKDLTDLRNYSLDKVTSGTYKGESKLFRQLAKQTFIKQWYNIKTPEDVARAYNWWQQTNNKSMMFFIGATPDSEGDDDVSYK